MKNKNICRLLIIVFAFFTGMTVSADVLPQSVSDIPKETMGVYQTNITVNVYAKPDEKSEVLYTRTTDYAQCKGIKTDNFYAVFVPEKELGYVYVTDVADDETWVQVIYDKQRNLKGWVQKSDDFQFLPWGIFFNMYGRKYGLYRLKTSALDFTGIYSQPDVNAQLMGKITRPKCIRMTSVEGCWMLVSVLDLSNCTTTGYVRWCTDNDDILLFPDIK